MKTTIDIPEKTLEDAMRFTGAKTKREAVVKALEAFNRQQRVAEVIGSFGTWDIATNDEIEAGDIEEIRQREAKRKNRPSKATGASRRRTGGKKKPHVHG